MSATRSNDEVSLSGYLYKKTRDGRWQKRWFETSGVYLTYYKSKKMEKLLAALSLPQVGGIRIISADEDPEKIEGLFALELSSRVYTLRAKSNAEAELWVKTLSKLRAQGAMSTLNPTAFANAIGTNTMPLEDHNDDEGKPPVGKKKLINVETSSAAVNKKTDWIKSMRSCFGMC